MEKQNFISVDGQTVRNSYGEFFSIGEVVGHEGAEDTATIVSFEPKKEENEITVYTDKGHAHIDFLIKLNKKKDIKLPREITLEELASAPCYQHSALTIGKLKELIAKYNLPDNGKVLIERVEDRYYEQNNWGVVFKEGYWFYAVVERNKEMKEEIERRTRGEESEYPDLENPQDCIMELSKELMDQYHPAYYACKSKDDDTNLYIDLHY